MRKADCAIRLRQPQQPDLIQRRLFTVHFHLYAAPSYIAKYGKPASIEELRNHRIVTFGEPVPPHLSELNWLETVGDVDSARRVATLQINDILSIKRRRDRHAARLCLREGFGPRAAPAGDRSALLRHLFLLSRRHEEPGQAQRLSRLGHFEVADLGVLVSLNLHGWFEKFLLVF
jgi:hypothetical protein